MTDKACAICVKRHATGAQLECRARPPVHDVVSRFPAVRPNDYCWSDFELDPEAANAHAAALAESARLDDLVARTQARAVAATEPVQGGRKSRSRRARSNAGQDTLL